MPSERDCRIASIEHPVDERYREQVLDLFWSTFGWKIGRIPFVGTHGRGRAFAAAIISFSAAYAAIGDDDRVLGVVFVAEQTRLTDPEPDALRAALGGGLLGRLVATAVCRAKRKPVAEKRPGVYEFEGFGVAEECRGAGIGTALFERAVADVRAAGGHALELTVADTNAGAIRLYERLGFRRTKSRWLGPLARPAGFTTLYTYELALASPGRSADTDGNEA